MDVWLQIIAPNKLHRQLLLLTFGYEARGILLTIASGSQHKNLCKIEKQDFHAVFWFPISMFKHIKENQITGRFFVFRFLLSKQKTKKGGFWISHFKTKINWPQSKRTSVSILHRFLCCDPEAIVSSMTLASYPKVRSSSWRCNWFGAIIWIQTSMRRT